MIRPNRDSRVIVSSIIYLITRTRSRQVWGHSHPLHTSNHRGLVAGRGAFNRAFHTGAQKSLEWTIGRHLTALTRGLKQRCWRTYAVLSRCPSALSLSSALACSPAVITSGASVTMRCSPSRRRQLRAGLLMSVPVCWLEPWAEPLPGQLGCCSQGLKIADRDGTLTFPAATSTTLVATLLVPQQTWCCVHGQHVIIDYGVCAGVRINQC